MNKKKNGFTLVELLATIIILGIILSVIGYITLNVINKSKDNTYKVTINEIESNANNYLIENNNRLFFVADKDFKKEYQCVTVENLVDYGYLDKNIVKSDVAKNKKVELDDYIYVERDINTKTVNKSIYVKTNPVYYDTCSDVATVLGDIVVTSVPGFDEWSKYKDVTITYKLNNLNDERRRNDYSFNYSYDGTMTYDESKDTFVNNIKTKKINLTSNGVLNANIMLGSSSIALLDPPFIINKIDNRGPYVILGNYSGSKTLGYNATIPIKLLDDGIGIDYSTFTQDDIEVYIGEDKISDFTLEKIDDENYNLKINNENHSAGIILKIPKGKILDKLGNENEEIVIDTDIQFKLYRLKIVGELDGVVSDDLIDSYTKLKYGKYTVKVDNKDIATDVTSFDRYIPYNSTYEIKITKLNNWKVNSDMKITKKMPDHDVTETLSFSVAAYKAIEAHGWGNTDKVGWIGGTTDIMKVKVGKVFNIRFSCPRGYMADCTIGVGLKDPNYKQINTTPQGYVNSTAISVINWMSNNLYCNASPYMVTKAVKPGYEVRSCTCFKYNRNTDKKDRYERRVIVAVAP